MAEEKRKPGRPPGSKNKTSSEKSGSSGKTSSGRSGSKSGSKTGKNPVKPEKPIKVGSKVRDEIWAIIIMALGIFLIVALQTSAAGAFGEILHKFFLGSFGIFAYVLPYYLLVYGILLFLDKTAHISGKSAVFMLIIFLMLTLLNSVRFIDTETFKMSAAYIIELFDGGVKAENGGLFGMFAGTLIAKAIGKPGLVILSVVVILVLLLLVLNTPVSQFFENAKIKRAEKQAERIAAYEEAERLAEEESLRLSAAREQEEAKTEIPEKTAKPERKEFPIKKDKTLKGTSLSSVPSRDADLSEAKPEKEHIHDYESSYVPGRMSEGQVNIMNYMKDDELFGHSEAGSVSYGLVENAAGAAKAASYGLTDAGSTGQSVETHVYNSNTDTSDTVKFGLIETPAEDTADMDMSDQNTSTDYTEAASEYANYEHIDSVSNTSIDLGADTGKNTSIAAAAVENVGMTAAAGTVSAVAGTGETLQSHAAPTDGGQPAYDTEKKLTKKEAENAMLSAEELNLPTEPPVKEYKFPPLDLLNPAKQSDSTGSNSDLIAKAQKLEDTLRNFHVDAKVIQVTKGPAVTRYEIQPAVGVKVSSITRLADDIALNLEAKSIRMEAPIPGKAAVGIEVENDNINMVTLREIIGSREFTEAKSKISFAVGKDISGSAIVGDLKGMPHLLIAGSTGSGKSVCINSIILSILYKAKPEEVKLVLVDPKVVELGNYNGIPHLLIPVVTEPSKAAAALNWAVAEMTERYKKFAEEGARDLESYNNAMRKKDLPANVMPQVVIIIDELADLMMAAPSQVEESICRLAQMARAAGMHLIVATQRPSVDVVTGLIKANIPSRIAFAVSSQVDSRTILDMGGAEKLVGKGDMLYNPLGLGKPIRVQGTFVSDDEVHNVIEFIKSQSEGVEYAGDVINTIENSGAAAGSGAQHDDDSDELLPDAIDLVVHSGQASVSMLQRRFRIGYNRAARIIDMMEARGIVGPPDGSKPRQVLMTEAELYALQSGTEEDTEVEEEI